MIAYKTVVVDLDGELCGLQCGRRLRESDQSLSFIDVYKCYLYGKQLEDIGNFRTKRCRECLKKGGVL